MSKLPNTSAYVRAHIKRVSWSRPTSPLEHQQHSGQGWPSETSTIHSPDCEFSFREMKHYWNLKSWNSKKFCWCCCLWQLSVRQWGIRGIGGIRRRPSNRNNNSSREWQDSSSSLANSDNNNKRRVSEDRGSKDDLTVLRPTAGLASSSGLSGLGPAHRGRRTSTSPTWRSSPTPSLIVTKIKGDLWIIHQIKKC